MTELPKSIRLTTPPFILSFPNLEKINEMAKKYTIDMIFNEDAVTKGAEVLSNPVTMVAFKKALLDFRKSHFPKGIPANVKGRAITKGSEKVKKVYNEETGETTSEQIAGYENSEFMNAGNAERPIMKDGLNQNAKASDLYGGSVCVAIIEHFFWDNDHGKGFGTKLIGIQKIADGQKFGKTEDPDALFSSVKVASSLDGL
jgi:hypothetical protein